MIYLILLLLVGGCSPTNLADMIKAAAKDSANLCGSVLTPYGSAKFSRTNCTNCNVVCNQDGMTVRSDAAQIGVPIQIVPMIEKR